jgi:hypothetical protein
MTPLDAVQKVAQVLRDSAAEPQNESKVVTALVEAGVQADIAGRAYKFTQIACGRKLLDGMGITFSNEFLCFNRFGDVVESGRLDEESYYRAALEEAVPEKMGGDAFANFAATSAEFDAVNNALNAGSEASNLVMAPAFLFLETPTESGIVSAHQVIQRHVQRIGKTNARRGPWWKFW